MPGVEHLNWSLRRWRTAVGGDWREGCSSVREQNGQRHVSIVCIKKCKPAHPFAEKHENGVMTKGQNPKAFLTLEQMGTASHGQSSKKKNR